MLGENYKRILHLGVRFAALLMVLMMTTVQLKAGSISVRSAGGSFTYNIDLKEAQPGYIHIKGWVFKNNHKQMTLIYGSNWYNLTKRQDVINAYSLPSDLNTGFDITIPLVSGSRTLTFRGYEASAGETYPEVFYVDVVVDKPTATFDKQGGTGGSNSASVDYSTANPTITTPVKSGSAFMGYYTGTNGTGTKYYNAEGTSAKNWAETGSKTLYASWVDAVAQIGDKGYTTVQAAIDAATSGQTVQMIASSPENVTINSGKNVTIDLNGKVLSATSGNVITNNGTLTLTDNAGGGNVTGGAKGVEQNGTLTVGGKVKITGNTANVYLPTGKIITVSSTTPLINGASIGVTTATVPASSGSVAVTDDTGAGMAKYFTADNSAYVIMNNGKPVVIANPSKYYVSANGDDTNGNGTAANPVKTLSKAMDFANGKILTICVMTDIVEQTFSKSSFTGNVTITSDDGDPATADDRFTVYAGSAGGRLWTFCGGTVSLANITLDGRIGGPTGTTKASGSFFGDSSATLNLQSGLIVQNFRATGTGGGSIILEVQGSSTINMEDGALLTGNIIDEGKTAYSTNPNSIIGVGTNSVLNIKGGKITGNTTTGPATAMAYLGTNINAYISGGEIYGNTMYYNDSYALYKRMQSATQAINSSYYFSGSARVFDNYDSNGNQKNVHRPEGTNILLNGALTEDAKIGISSVAIPTSGGVVAVGFSPYVVTDADANGLFDDRQTLKIIKHATNNQLVFGTAVESVSLALNTLTTNTLTGTFGAAIGVTEKDVTILKDGVKMEGGYTVTVSGTSLSIDFNPVLPENNVTIGVSVAKNGYKINNGEVAYIGIHRHCICGDGTCTVAGHTHTDIDWQVWSSTTTLPTTAGNWYLANDVMLTARYYPVNGVNLCLNGHVVKQTTNGECVVSIASGVTFQLTDCDNTATHNFSVGSNGLWKLTSAEKTVDFENLTARPATGAVVAVKGGALTGGKDADGSGSGLLNYGTFNLFRGNIVGNDASGEWGGGILLSKDGGVKSRFDMTGGNIIGNLGGGNGGGGVAIRQGCGVFTLRGGIIGFNTAAEGGGITNGGDFTMTGGEIIYNAATSTYYGGGGVDEWASNYGGYSKILGGRITGNISASYGGGVYLWTGSTYSGNLVVGGDAFIANNTVGGSANNVYLLNGKTITVSTETPLTTSTPIGVTTATAPTSATPVAVTGTNNADYSMYFLSDNMKYAVVNEDNVVKLKVSVECNTTTAYNPTNIVNGDFEVKPVCTPTNRNAPDGGWNTTEIEDWCGMYFEWISKTWGDRGYNTALLGAKDNAVVEMNCQNAAVLYQDLTTRGRDVIRWTLNHGVVTRSGESQQDIRVMVGAPLRDGSGNIIHATGVGTNVDAKINNTTLATYESTGVTNGGDIYGYANVSELAALSLNRSTQASSWYTAKGVYVVPEGQTVTRFAFISLDATTPANGNLLDAITFSTLVGNLQAYTDANGDVIIIGYWGDTDASKKLCVKAGETVYQYDMSGVKTTCGGDFKITFSKSQIGTATEVEIYHQDYPSTKVTVKIATHVTLHFCTTETVTGAEDFYGYIPGETTLLPVVSRNGYTFKGWYTNSEYTGEPVTEIGPTETSKTLEFYAKWEVDITSDRWAAVVRAYDKGDRPLTGSYTYYPGGTGSATTVPYEGALYTDPDGNKYYCYKTVEMAIEAAQAGALNTNYCSATNPNGVFTEGTPYNYELNDGVNPNIINYTDVVTLNKDYNGFIYNIGTDASQPTRYGIRKGIVLDLNGKTVRGISMGEVTNDQVLIVRNGTIDYKTDSNPKVFDDETGTGSLTGKVVFRDVTLRGRLWASKHEFFMLNGSYNITLGSGEDPNLLQLRGGYYMTDPSIYNIDYTDCHVELASSDPTISPYFCRVVKGASQYTINFHPNGNGNMVGGVEFTGKSVAMTYNGSLDEVPAITREGCVIVGWATSDGAVTPEYTTSQLNTISKQHGAVVDIYPVWGVTVGIPVYVAMEKGSDIPEIGRQYTFELIPKNGAPSPEVMTLTLDSPTVSESGGKVGYNDTDITNPWKVTLKDGTYLYYVKQTGTALEAETLDAGYWKTTVMVHALEETRYEMSNIEYTMEISDLGENAFKSYKYSGAASFSSAEKSIIFGSDTQTVTDDDDFNRAAVKSTFAFDFKNSFIVSGTLQVGAAADGSLVGFVPAAGDPVFEENQGSSLGIYEKSAQGKGVFLEFDTYGTGDTRWGDQNYSNQAHFAIMTTNASGNPQYAGNGYGFGSQFVLPSGVMNYRIEYTASTKKMKFTITKGETTYGPWTLDNPTGVFGTDKAYMILAGAMRFGPELSYGTGEYGTPAPKTKLTFELFNYIHDPQGMGDVNNTFVNKLDHVWQYTAEGNTLSAHCKHDHGDATLTTHCALPGIKDLVVTATDHNYNGEQHAATITTDEWTAAGIEKPVIKYAGVTPTTYGEIANAPANFGKYQATIKAGEATAASPFVIRPQIYCVSADPTHGSVNIKNGNGDLITSGSFVEPYENVTLTATAVEHWHFKNWTTLSKYDNPDPVDVLQLQMNENIKYYTANFEIDKHTVTAMPNVATFGSVTVQNVTSKSGDGTVSVDFNYGSAVLLTAIPADVRYTFLYWTKVADTTEVISTSKTYQFTLTNDTTFKAIFVDEVQVNIEAAPLDGGQVAIKNNVTGQYLTPEEAKHILYGTSVTIEATCSEDYAFAGWYIKGTNTLFSKKQSMTFDATTLVLNLEARFTDAVIWVRVKK